MSEWVIVGVLAFAVVIAMIVQSATWKSKMRVIGRRRKNWVRFHPNAGFQIGKFHYCRFHGFKPHDTRYKFRGKIETLERDEETGEIIVIASKEGGK